MRRNDVIGLALVVLVALAPIPLASHRPVLWMLTDALVFVILLAQSILRVFDRDPRDRFLPRHKSLILLFTAVALWQVVQLLPLGVLLPGPETGVGGYGATISIVPGQTVLILLNFCAYGAVTLLAYQVGQRQERGQKLFAAFGVMVSLFALYSLYVFAAENNALLGQPRTFYVDDAAGTFVNRNSFATFLGLGLVLNTGLAASALFDERDRRSALGALVLHGLAAAIILAGLFATHSRMGLFASLVGAVVALIVFIVRSRSSWQRRLIGMGLGLAGLVTMAVLYGAGLLERLSSTQTSLDVRMAFYAQVLDLIGLRPLSGFGAGSFAAAFPLVHQLPVDPDKTWNMAHNTYLTLFAELGVPVGLAAIALVGVMLVGIARTGMDARHTLLAASVGFGASAQVGVHALVDFSLEIHAVALLYAAILGLCLGATAGARTA